MNIFDIWKLFDKPILVKREHWADGNYAYVSNVVMTS